MRPLVVILLALVAALGMFAAANWPLLSAPVQVSLLATEIEAPLGMILFGFAAAIAVVGLLALASMRTAMLLESRRTLRELQAQRALAEQAEGSRVSALQQSMQADLARLSARIDEAAAADKARAERTESELRAAIGQLGNSLAAQLAELDDRLGRSGAITLAGTASPGGAVAPGGAATSAATARLIERRG